MSKIYTKNALTTDQQVDLLRERGLKINDEKNLRHYLNTVGYYCLSGYFKIFQDKDDIFLENITFEKVLKIYFFDRKLRLLFLDGLERIEKAFRTQFVSQISLRHGPYYFDKEHIQNRHKEKIMNILQRSKEPFIEKFQKKYPNQSAPLWILAEVLSFGDILNFYITGIENEDKKEIARYFNLGWKFFYSWLENLREVRNTSAHHSRLWNKKITKQLRKGDQYPAITYNGRIFDSIFIITILLQKISPDYRWISHIEKLISQYEIDTKRMGFPQDWKSIFI